ncbi:MAG: YbjQ family protein [bacterium]
MEALIIFIALIAIGYFMGNMMESRHYKSIERRERRYLTLPAVDVKHFLDNPARVEKVQLVHGSVVISIDYFKRLLAGLRNIFGGEVTSYETLLDRARREAILRMKEMAGSSADIILNLRIETSIIGNNADKKNSVGSIETIAYGTAITYKKA